MIYLSAIMSSGCSTFQIIKTPTEFINDPEVEAPLDSNLPIATPTAQAKLSVAFNLVWQATLDTLHQSGYSIQKADQKEGLIQTLDKKFNGPTYPWRENFSIRIIPIDDDHTTIRVKRQVKVYRRLLLIGPLLWMTKNSNGRREKMLIERITHQTDITGADQGEN
jgi:hypothetical protein